MSRKIVGLDIRKDWISVVIVESSMKGNWVEAYEHISIQEQKNKEDIKDVASLLKDLINKFDIAGSNCIVSFPSDQISYRNIQIPFSDQKKIKQILPFELEPLLCFPIENLLIDYHIINQGNQSALIAITIERSKFISFLNNFEVIKLEPERVTISGYATALCITTLLNNLCEKLLFIDIDIDNCTIFIIINKKIHLIRTLPIDNNPSLRIDNISKNIKRTLSGFEESQNNEIHPEKIIITGCLTGDLDFDKELSKILEMPVEKLDLASDSKMLINASSETPWKSEKMDNALALTLIDLFGISGINFRKGEFAPKKQWVVHKKSFIKTGVLASLFIILAFLSLLIDTFTMGKKLNNLNYQINAIFKKSFPDVKNIVDPLQQMKVKIQEEKKNYVMPGESEKNLRSIDILKNISSRVSNSIDVELDRFVIAPDSVLISGNTDTFNSVNDMKNNIEASGIFKKVTISSADTDRSGNRVNFKLKVDI